MSDESTVILGLGSNVGERVAYLEAAVGRLSALVRGMRCSRIVESQALLAENAPPEWNMPYLNMAVGGLSDIAPQTLLDAVKIIERDLGRISRGVWGPREIDIDILAMGDKIIMDCGLTIPHSELLKRDFALLPLVDVAADWRYPVAGKYYGWRAADIAADKGFSLRDTGLKLHD